MKKAMILMWVVSLMWPSLVLAQTKVPQLMVRGESQLMVPPDQVSIHIGVTSEAKDAKQAMADNTEKMARIIKALASLSLSEKDYKTANFDVQPVWSRRPRNAQADWQATIVAYRVNNTLQVTSQVLDSVGDIIAKATQAGSNRIHSIMFGLANPRQYREQAIEQAVNNATADANIVAKASGNQLKRTLSISLDNAVANPVFMDAPVMKARMMSEMAAPAPPPIAAGDITVNASVSMTFELQ